MVRGLQLFREHFLPFRDQYILIGGTACDLIMKEAGLEFRSTKDLDIVLSTESLEPDFIEAWWSFIRSGKYQSAVLENRERRYYRFQEPLETGYPSMLELFSRKPDGIPMKPGMHLTPIPVEPPASSLSAILLEDDYYGFLRSGRIEMDGIPIAGTAHLIGLKAKAWLDLSARRSAGESVDSRSITKHKNDVFRLYRVLDPTQRIAAPEKVRGDLADFLTRVSEEGVDTRALGLAAGVEKATEQIRATFGLA